MCRQPQPAIGLLILICSLLISLIPAESWAQQEDEEPLRLVFLNTAGGDGQRVYRTIEGFLTQSQQIDLIDPQDFMKTAAESGFDNNSFRASSEREANIDGFHQLMRQVDAEGILVQDVFGRGNTLQIVVLGPRGWEIADIRRSIHRSRIDDDDALSVLREVFQSLVPEVRGYRRELEEQAAQPDPEDALLVVNPHDSNLSIREQAVAEHRRRYGDMKPGIAGRLGPIFGYRQMRLGDELGSFEFVHRTPLIGVGVQLDGLITTFDRHTGAIEVGGFAAFAPYSTIMDGAEFAGRFLRVGGDLRYISARNESLRIRGIAGLELTNFSLDSNSIYTGHGYLMGRLGLGIHYGFGSLMTLQTDLLLMPILTSSNSGGAYGDASGWLAYGADVGLHLDILSPFLVSLTYSFQRLDLNYPDPLPEILDHPASTADMIHQAMLTLGYEL